MVVSLFCSKATDGSEEAGGNSPEDGKQDVDKQVSAAATLEEHSERWENDGENDLADVAGKGNVSKHLHMRGEAGGKQ